MEVVRVGCGGGEGGCGGGEGGCGGGEGGVSEVVRVG